MDKATLARAETIIRRGHIKIGGDSEPPYHLHFQVLQRSGVWCDVWKKTMKGMTSWSCNAIGKKRNGDKFGCVFFKCDKSEPFCSHTLAASKLLKKIKSKVI